MLYPPLPVDRPLPLPRGPATYQKGKGKGGYGGDKDGRIARRTEERGREAGERRTEERRVGEQKQRKGYRVGPRHSRLAEHFQRIGVGHHSCTAPAAPQHRGKPKPSAARGRPAPKRRSTLSNPPTYHLFGRAADAQPGGAHTLYNHLQRGGQSEGIGASHGRDQQTMRQRPPTCHLLIGRMREHGLQLREIKGGRWLSRPVTTDCWLLGSLLATGYWLLTAGC